MGTVGNAVLIGLVFVVALVAVSFGLRRVRVPVDQERRGFLGHVRTAFYAAAGVILGTSASCSESDDGYETAPGPDDARIGCYVDPGAGEEWIDRDDGSDADEGDEGPDPSPEVQDSGDEDLGPGDDVEEPPDVEPDAETPDVEDPDAEGADAFIGLAPEERQRREKWARRTLERAREVRRLLADPGTEPAVREVLRADMRGLRRQVQRARKWVRGNNSGGAPSAA